jgi:filamentous hemagglutinin family protein
MRLAADCFIAATVLGAFARLVSAGTIVTDGTLAPARSLSGPAFLINSNLGTTQGGNLFQSFKTFDLSAGDVATFSGPSTIKNILARVTGGQSNIDGTLACSIPSADFFLIDQSGVVFGPDAKLNVQGSFIVTTANEINLKHGGVFSGGGSTSDVLTTAAPAAFGFLKKSPARVTSSAALAVGAGKGLSIVAGRIVLQGGQLVADSGRVNLVAAGASGQVGITSEAGTATSIDASTLPTLADVVMSTGASISTSGSFGGVIMVAARNLSMDHSEMDSDGTGAFASKGISIALSGDLSLANSDIESNNFGSGQGGAVGILAGNVRIDGNGSTNDLTDEAGVFANSMGSGPGGDISVKTHSLTVLGTSILDVRPYATGNAGQVTIFAHQILFDSQGTVSDTSDNGIDAYGLGTTGNAGNVSVHTDILTMADGGAIVADSAGPGASGGIISISANQIDANGIAAPDASTGIISDAPSGGNAGAVRVTAGNVTVDSNAEISASANQDGTAGNINIVAQSLTTDGTDTASDNFTGITVQSNGTAGGGAGQLTLNVGNLRVLNGANVSAVTFGTGTGGGIRINANNITMFGTNVAGDSTSIGVSSEGTSGNAGELQINADSIELYSGADIEAVTNGQANGGDVSIRTKTLSIDGSGSTLLTAVTAEQGTKDAGGNAGNVTVVADTISLTRGGRISDDTFGSGRAGNVSVQTNELTIDGAKPPPHTPTGIDSTARKHSTGPGGQVIVNAGDVRVLNGGHLAAISYGPGNGGNITLATGNLTLDGGAQVATSADESGGGDVTIDARNIRLKDGSISAAAALTGGTIDVSSRTLALSSQGTISATSHGSATGDNGGDITFEPTVLTFQPLLMAGAISANANQGHGGNIVVAPGGDLLLPQGASASAEFSATGREPGTITVEAPELNLAGELTPLLSPLIQPGVTLAPACGMQVGQDESSFVIEGGNGLPADPGNLLGSGLDTTQP